MAYRPIVEVDITLAASGITAQGFGTPLFIADIDTDTSPDPLGAGVRVKTYSNLEEVADDFETTSNSYKAAQALFSYTPRLPQIKIGYRDTGVAAETITEAYSAIRADDNDFYFVTAETHTTSEILELATAVEASIGLYFFSYGEADALTVFDEGTSTDALALVKEGNFLRTKGFFHHEADTSFPECDFIAYNATYLAGSVSWANLQLSVPASQDPDTGKPLSTTQKGYLEDRDATYTERVFGQTIITRNSLTASGVHNIDTIHGADALQEDLNVALAGLLLRQKGGKLPYTNTGITQIYNVVDNVLNIYSSNPRNYLNNNYVLDFKMANQVPVADKEARVYRSGTFRAELQGAIEGVSVSGTVTVQL